MASGGANFGTLEDCHTNLFLLTELNGIKWRKLECPAGQQTGQVANDPILQGFARCMHLGYLATWRRVRRQPSDFSLRSEKELWIFWYKDEPDLSKLPACLTSKTGEGSWESGIPYEVRTLLFKSLHNLIERSLLTQGFIRVGRFFAEPFDLNGDLGGAGAGGNISGAATSASRSSPGGLPAGRPPGLTAPIPPTPNPAEHMLMFAFTFLLHGENQVCVSVDVQKHSPVYRLDSGQLAQLAEHRTSILLLPWGLKGLLTGQMFRSSENPGLWDEWSRFYPLSEMMGQNGNGIDSGGGLEANLGAGKLGPGHGGIMVEVNVSGVLMKWPLNFVVVPSSDSAAAGATAATSCDRRPGTMAPSRPPGAVATRKSTAPARGPSHKRQSASVQKLVRTANRDFVMDPSFSDSAPSASASAAPNLTTAPAPILNGPTPSELSHSSSLPPPASAEEPELWGFRDASQRTGCGCGRLASAAAPAKRPNVVHTKAELKFGMVAGGLAPAKIPRTAFHKRSHIDVHRLSSPAFQGISPVSGPTYELPCSGNDVGPVGGSQIMTSSADVTLTGVPQSAAGGVIDPYRQQQQLKPPPFDPSGATGEEDGGAFANRQTQGVTVISGGSCEGGGDGGVPLNPAAAETNLQLHPHPPPQHHGGFVDQVVRPQLTGAERTPVQLQLPRLQPLPEEEEEHDAAVTQLRPPAAVQDLLPHHHAPGAPGGTALPAPPTAIIGPPGSLGDDGQTTGLFLGEPGATAAAGASMVNLNPDVALPDDFMDTDGENPATSSMLSPPPSTERCEREDATSLTAITSTGGSLMKAGHHLSVVGTTSVTLISNVVPSCPSIDYNYSKIFPTPPSCENIPSSVFEASPISFYDCVWAKDFQNFSLTGASHHQPSLWSKSATSTALSDFAGDDTSTISCLQYQPQPPMAVNFRPPLSITQPPSYPGYSSMDTNGSVPQPHSTKTDGGGSLTDMSPAGPLSNLRTPVADPIHSPMSNASQRNLSSVELPPQCKPVEGHSLSLVLLLCDSFVNHFTDPSFDSCTLCACRMDLIGWEDGRYVNPMFSSSMNRSAGGANAGSSSSNSSQKCDCGFSATRSRYLGALSGLFYEDELDVCGLWRPSLPSQAPVAACATGLRTMVRNGAGSQELNGTLAPGLPPEPLLDLIRSQCHTSYVDNLVCAVDLPSSATVSRSGQSAAPPVLPYSSAGYDLICNDFRLLCEVAVEQSVAACGSGGADGGSCHSGKPPWFDRASFSKLLSFGRWCLVGSECTDNSAEVLGLLKRLLPHLQESMQRPRGLWESKHFIEGPLTWRSFNRKCSPGRHEDCCETEPNPTLMLATERDWIAAPPYALRFWDSLLMEPHGGSRDVAYVVVSPENHTNRYILSQVRLFFRELSETYESMKLGRHCPIVKVLKDGIMRVGRTHAKKMADTEVDGWYGTIGDASMATRLKTYAQVCRHILAKYLTDNVVLDGSLFQNSSGCGSCGSGGETDQPTAGSSAYGPDCGSNATACLDSGSKSTLPTVVVYMVNPWSDQDPLGKLGLTHCYLEMLSDLPAKLRSNVVLQIVSLDQILQVQRCQEQKSLALSVYSQARTYVIQQYHAQAKSLTGFGPAAGANALSVNKPADTIMTGVWSAPYVIWEGSEVSKSQLYSSREQASLLMLSYSLSHDGNWLLVSCTDQHGLFSESCVINLNVADRKRCEKGAFVSHALKRLWDFVMGVMASSCRPWRLVISRLGRLGPSEIRAWGCYLSKSGLRNSSRLLREQCTQCRDLPFSVENPSILSACLISTEPEPYLRLFADAAGMSQNSCTHIMVFPTSAHMTGGQANNQIQPGMDDDLNDLLGGIDILDPDITSLANEIGGADESERTLETSNADASSSTIQYQPLALGYYVSTAPTGPLPPWFWDSCPDAQDRLPVHLKSALHIHTGFVQQSDDLLHSSTQPTPGAGPPLHPLDSSLTTDVLRCALETYNSLSWLNVDLESGRRRSCLPVHIQALVRLYNTLCYDLQ